MSCSSTLRRNGGSASQWRVGRTGGATEKVVHHAFPLLYRHGGFGHCRRRTAGTYRVPIVHGCPKAVRLGARHNKACGPASGSPDGRGAGHSLLQFGDAAIIRTNMAWAWGNERLAGFQGPWGPWVHVRFDGWGTSRHEADWCPICPSVARDSAGQAQSAWQDAGGDRAGARSGAIDGRS